MFYKLKSLSKVLQISDSFVSLVEIQRDDTYVFEVKYKVSQSEIVKQNVMNVHVSLITKIVKPPSFFDSVQPGKVDAQALIKNMQLQMPLAKSSLKKQETFVVASKKSDITAKINNEIVGQLKAGVSKEYIPQLTKSKLTLKSVKSLKQTDEIKPMLNMIAHTFVNNPSNELSASVALNSQSNMLNMIIKEGIDPSVITKMTHRSTTAFDSFGGLSKKMKGKEVEFSSATKLLHKYIFASETDEIAVTSEQVADEANVQVVESVTGDDVELSVFLKLPAYARKEGGKQITQYFVRFEAIDSTTGATVDVQQKTLDVLHHLRLFQTPLEPPIVKMSRSEVSSRVNIEIKQVDVGALGISLYKKTIPRSSVEIEDYKLVEKYDLKSTDGTLLIQVEKPLFSTSIYRVIPHGAHGTVGAEFTNVVVRPSKVSELRAIALSSVITDDGISIEMQNIPYDVVSVDVMRKNVSIHERDFTSISGPILVDDAARHAGHIDYEDVSVLPGNVYEYIARLFYKKGTIDFGGTTQVEYVPQQKGKVDIKISNVAVTHGNEPNVTFTMTSTILNNDIDVIKILLERQDIKEYFNENIMQEKEFLKGLIAHNVHRIDTTTGDRVDFGVVIDEQFSDDDLRKNLSIESLKYGHKYRYEVYTLIRAPETMFEGLIKTKKDKTTNKWYSFRPAKFLHPVALNQGTIVTASGLRTLFAKDPMVHGLIGTYEFLEVSFDGDQALVINPIASRFDRDTVTISWGIVGSMDQVDHFLIMKELNGVRTMVGKAHSEFLNNTCEYLHTITERDWGQLTYVIVPIFNDYRVGSEASTNSIILE